MGVAPARPDELPAAFRLVFRHLSKDDREARVANALEMVRQGELDPNGVLVVRGGRGLLGAMVCLPVPGASGLVWPPQVLAHNDRGALENQLVHKAGAWLRRRGAKLAQALLLPEEASLAEPLTRNGFRRITRLWYMRHDLDGRVPILRVDGRLAFQTYPRGDPSLFHQTLLRTYEGTHDCPEVNGVRTIHEIIAGHQAQGRHDPRRWWLALDEDQPVGVLLLAEVPESRGWDLSYLGVVPEARRRGFGRALAGKALWEAQAADSVQLTLAVDTRNRAAWNLYRSLGFEPYAEREVYLAIWGANDPRSPNP
jgi:ribosomal protein S18 acetylase RimI-like enzyme